MPILLDRVMIVDCFVFVSVNDGPDRQDIWFTSTRHGLGDDRRRIHYLQGPVRR